MTQDQLSLMEIHELVLPQHEVEDTLEQRFQRFHQANRWLLDAYATLTREQVAAGARRVSINMLTEVLRYKAGVTHGTEPWRINNSFRSYYSRLLVSTYPEFDGLFETRSMPSMRAAS